MIQRRPILWATAPVVPEAGERVEDPIALLGDGPDQRRDKFLRLGIVKGIGRTKQTTTLLGGVFIRTHAGGDVEQVF